MTGPHTFQPMKSGKQCQLCGGWADHPDHQHKLWSSVDHEREQARLAYQAEEMTAKMRTPLGDINKATGILERESPLFGSPTLF